MAISIGRFIIDRAPSQEIFHSTSGIAVLQQAWNSALDYSKLLLSLMGRANWLLTWFGICLFLGTKFSSKFFIFLCAGLNSWVQAWIWLTDQQDYGLKSLLTNRFITNIAIKSYYTRLPNWHRFYVFQFSIFFQAQMPNFCLFSALRPNPEFRVVENVIITAINLVTFFLVFIE